MQVINTKPTCHDICLQWPFLTLLYLTIHLWINCGAMFHEIHQQEPSSVQEKDSCHEFPDQKSLLTHFCFFLLWSYSLIDFIFVFMLTFESSLSLLVTVLSKKKQHFQCHTCFVKPTPSAVLFWKKYRHPQGTKIVLG